MQNVLVRVFIMLMIIMTSSSYLLAYTEVEKVRDHLADLFDLNQKIYKLEKKMSELVAAQPVINLASKGDQNSTASSSSVVSSSSIVSSSSAAIRDPGRSSNPHILQLFSNRSVVSDSGTLGKIPISIPKNCFLKSMVPSDEFYNPGLDIFEAAFSEPLESGELKGKIIINNKYYFTLKEKSFSKFQELWDLLVIKCVEKKNLLSQLAQKVSECNVRLNRNLLVDPRLSFKKFPSEDINEITSVMNNLQKNWIRNNVGQFIKRYGGFKGARMISNYEERKYQYYVINNFLKILNINPVLFEDIDLDSLVEVLKNGLYFDYNNDFGLMDLFTAFMEKNFNRISQMLDRESTAQNNLIYVLKKHQINHTLVLDDVLEFYKKENDILLLIRLRTDIINSWLGDLKIGADPEHLPKLQLEKLRSEIADAIAIQSHFRIKLMLDILERSNDNVNLYNWKGRLLKLIDPPILEAGESSPSLLSSSPSSSSPSSTPSSSPSLTSLSSSSSPSSSPASLSSSSPSMIIADQEVGNIENGEEIIGEFVALYGRYGMIGDIVSSMLKYERKLKDSAKVAHQKIKDEIWELFFNKNGPHTLNDLILLLPAVMEEVNASGKDKIREYIRMAE